MTNNWQRIEGETDNQYIFRICSHKDEIGTWYDVADIINETLGLDKDECCYRKSWKAFQDLQKVNVDNTLDGQEILQDIRNERRELEKEKVKFRDERNEVRRLMRIQARGESMRELIERCIDAHDPAEFQHIKFFDDSKRSTDMIVHLTDLHAGAGIKNSFNVYDKSIMSDRIKEYCNKVAEVAHRHNVEKCYVVLGGDLVNGAIHVNSRLENNEHIIQQVISAAEEIAWFVSEISRFMKDVKVFSVPGNHSRLFPNKEQNQYGEYLDKLVTYIVNAKCSKLYNVTFIENKIEDSIASFCVKKKLVYAVHGDKDSASSVVQNLTMMTGIKPDIVLMGHRHTNGLTTVYDTKVYESGCISGPDSYCMDKRLRNNPEQTIIIVGDDGVDCAYDVTLR